MGERKNMTSKVVLSIVQCSDGQKETLAKLISDNLECEVVVIDNTLSFDLQDSKEQVAEEKQKSKKGKKSKEIVLQEPKEQNPTDEVFSPIISEALLSVGVPANILGFRFLQEGIRLVGDKPSLMYSLTKGLYPSIAKSFETTSSKVERAIRHAIEVAWGRDKMQRGINNMFGKDIYAKSDKPTNGEFIALVKEKLLIDGFAK